MFSSSLRASLVALVASAVIVSAAPAVPGTPSVTVKTSAPNVNVDGSKNLKVTTTITNTGGETLKLLNDPRGSLNSFPENTFTITDPNGSQPSFNGARVKYNPEYAARLDDPSVSTVLAPGDSVSVVHDLFRAYDFTQSGPGDYTIEPSNRFTHVDADGSPKNFYATVEGTAKVKLSGNLAVSRTNDKRADPNSCSDSQKLDLYVAATDAQLYASEAYGQLTATPGGTERYTTWFGAYDYSRETTVQEHFGLVASRNFLGFIYDCTCTDPGFYAYVYPEDFGKIYLCGAFWEAPATGTDSKAGTLVHESSHFTINGGTKDYAYGHTRCQNLANSNPIQAIFNADSHEYFAENNPALF